ncbi:unnamed protein product (macronuclear) [Paramecium tetraurelia]|uniref:FCP1 homology domain-containing protein n=1 Tax=Paramecium tetraurelia TaxID=5888 RepID=A0DXE4_PARTE|nr:uncharacterized protein GSPATT00021344001 [Paramecium tetraurelia]CAK87711.1 unnamed protein product [Paramecium tetraurelia]|eukprot:XP_001455108.1 hypothetical protein (macronuclear) [Paramecium tetraurelia strain d4-2]
MSIVALFKNCYEHFKGKFQKNYISAQTPKQYSQKKVLVLDLDETLVHCEFKENENFQHEVLLEVIHKGQLYTVYLKARPYLNQFLQEASKDYEIFIFTAGYEAYCQEVLSFIDKKKIISDYYARGSCQFIDGICYKDLQLIDRPMGDIIFIDNNPNAFIKCQDNGLLIPSFLDSEDDDCLLRLIPFLKYMAKKKDLRPVEQHLKIYEDNNGTIVFCETQKSIQIEQEEPDEDTLSEGKVVKREQDVTDLDIKHKKTQTQLETVNKIKSKLRSVTLFSSSKHN